MKPFRTSLLLRSRQRNNAKLGKVIPKALVTSTFDSYNENHVHKSLPLDTPEVSYYVDYFGRVTVEIDFSVEVISTTSVVELRNKVIHALSNDGFGLQIKGMSIGSVRLTSPSGETDLYYPGDDTVSHLLKTKPEEKPDHGDEKEYPDEDLESDSPQD